MKTTFADIKRFLGNTRNYRADRSGVKNSNPFWPGKARIRYCAMLSIEWTNQDIPGNVSEGRSIEKSWAYCAAS